MDRFQISRPAAITSIALVLVCLLPFQNCSVPEPAIKAQSSYQSEAQKQLALYEKDMTLLEQQSLGATDVDSSLQGAFSKGFGGLDAAALSAYLNDRVKHVVAMDALDEFSMQPTSFIYTNWTKSEFAPLSAQSQTYVMAMNLGTALWLMGKVDGVAVQIASARTGAIPIPSTRAGIIVLGQGYRENSPQDPAIVFHPEIRIGTLLHEARHSDCTGGLAETFVNSARTSASMQTLLTSLNAPQISCGHLHIVCPTGHTLAGIPACDTNVWGAYGVEVLYLMARLNQYPADSAQRGFTEILLFDTLSRLPEGANDLYKTTSPDMSHTDVP